VGIQRIRKYINADLSILVRSLRTTTSGILESSCPLGRPVAAPAASHFDWRPAYLFWVPQPFDCVCWPVAQWSKLVCISVALCCLIIESCRVDNMEEGCSHLAADCQEQSLDATFFGISAGSGNPAVALHCSLDNSSKFSFLLEYTIWQKKSPKIRLSHTCALAA
jgi:hypothetical protein